jgi:hypothetical protein
VAPEERQQVMESRGWNGLVGLVGLVGLWLVGLGLELWLVSVECLQLRQVFAQ